MQRIDHVSNAVAPPARPADNAPGYFAEGPPGTVVTDAWANDVQEELVAIIVEVGLDTLDSADRTQCAEALGGARAIVAHATDTGVVSTKNLRGLVAVTDSQATGADSACVACNDGLASGANSAVLGALGSEAGGAQSAVVGCNNVDVTGDNAAAIASSGGYVADNKSLMAASTGSYITAGNSALIASDNVEVGASYILGLGFDGGAARTPQNDGSNYGLTIAFDAVNGNGYFDGVADNGNADFAEMMENAELGALGPGLLLARVGRRVRVAGPSDRLVGVVSAAPAVLGNTASLGWSGRFDHDEWGRRILEPVTMATWPAIVRYVDAVELNERGEPVKKRIREVVRPAGSARYDASDPGSIPEDAKIVTVQAPRPSPLHDRSAPYVSRRDRPEEWTPVALVGQVRVRIGAQVTAETVDLVAGHGGVAVPGQSGAGARLELLEILAPFSEAKGYGIGLALVR